MTSYDFNKIILSEPAPDETIPNFDIDAKSIDAQEIIRFKQDTKHRGLLVKWMMFVVSLWLLAVLVMLFVNPLLEIRDSVLITLLATTTVNVLGLANIILKGLFGDSFRKSRYRKKRLQ